MKFNYNANSRLNLKLNGFFNAIDRLFPVKLNPSRETYAEGGVMNFFPEDLCQRAEKYIVR